MIVTFTRAAGNVYEAQLFASAPDGAWGPLGPRRELGGISASTVAVDGDRLFTDDGVSYSASDERLIGVAVHDPVRRVVPLPWDAAFGGDMAAFVIDTASGDGASLVVVDWRTGARISSTAFRRTITSYRVRPDGRVVAGVGGDLLEIAPGGARKRLARDVGLVSVAGERVVVYRGGALAVLDPDGAERGFGIPTERLRRAVADERHVLWHANGCLLAAAITDARAREPGPGPCERTEFAVLDESVRLGRTVSLRLRCVAAPAGGCRGTVRLRTQAGRRGYVPASLRKRARIPAGSTRAVTLKVRAKQRALIRRARHVLADVRLPSGRLDTESQPLYLERG